jgi:hypothetical protein
MKTKQNKLSVCAVDINPSAIPLNPEILRSFPGCEHYSETKANNIMKTLEKLSAVCHQIIKAKEINIIDNQQVVYLNLEKRTKSKAA